jgi:predicted nucleotidyltransferase
MMQKDIMRMWNETEKIIVKSNPEQRWIFDNCVIAHCAGSIMYGTNKPTSDLDIRGVVIPPKSYWVGAKSFEHFQYQDNELDIALWDIRKFVREICRVAPNTIETLFAPSNCIFYMGDCWPNISQQIKQLINQSAYMAYYGYSTAQLKKMIVKHGNKTGRQYITEEFGMDVKFLMHGFRLVSQGCELLTTGNITFPRPDAEQLKAIREGKTYGFNDMDKAIADLAAAQDLLKIALDNTILPKKVDHDQHNQLLIDIYEQYVA